MKRILFFVLIFLSQSLLSSVDEILREYPELSNFFSSSEFKSRASKCPIKIVQGDPQKRWASFDVEASLTNGITQKIVLNSFYINRNRINAEEFKFMLCHELGHLNDKTLFKRILLPSIGFALFNLGLATSVIKSLAQKNWCLSFKKINMGFGLSFLGYLVLQKFSRVGETFADEYAIKITKNREAAASVLSKRKSLKKTTPFKFEFLNRLSGLLDDHPSEEVRIKSINKVQI